MSLRGTDVTSNRVKIKNKNCERLLFAACNTNRLTNVNRKRT